MPVAIVTGRVKSALATPISSSVTPPSWAPIRVPGPIDPHGTVHSPHRLTAAARGPGTPSARISGTAIAAPTP